MFKSIAVRRIVAQRSSSAEEASEDLSKSPALKSSRGTHSAVYLVPTESLAWEDTQSVSGCFEMRCFETKPLKALLLAVGATNVFPAPC